ncbi:MAG: hypothetical protein AB8B97_21365 [Granulosicoccus sp.]
MSDNSCSVKLRPVTTFNDDIDLLFCLLNKRQFGISHRRMPSFDEHRAFVTSHPYRAWYFVENSQLTVGSVYLLESNHIGVNVLAGYASCINPAIKLLCALHQPLPPISSVRGGKFEINAAPADVDLIKELEGSGAVMIQKTYQIP